MAENKFPESSENKRNWPAIIGVVLTVAFGIIFIFDLEELMKSPTLLIVVFSILAVGQLLIYAFSILPKKRIFSKS